MGCQPVYMWGVYLSPITTQIRETHIIGQDDDDVWMFPRASLPFRWLRTASNHQANKCYIMLFHA